MEKLVPIGYNRLGCSYTAAAFYPSSSIIMFHCKLQIMALGLIRGLAVLSVCAAATIASPGERRAPQLPDVDAIAAHTTPYDGWQPMANASPPSHMPNTLARRSNVEAGDKGDPHEAINEPAHAVGDTAESSPAKPQNSAAMGERRQERPTRAHQRSEAAQATAQADKQTLAKERIRMVQSRHTVKLSRFLTLDAARTWLPGPSPAHVDRVGAFRVLVDVWNEYDGLAKRLRKLTAPEAAPAPPAAAAAATEAPAPRHTLEAKTAAAARARARQRAREIAEVEESMRRLLPWTYRRKQFGRYMARLAGAMAPAAPELNIEAAVDATAAELRRLGHDLPARAAELVPPNEWPAAAARAEAARAEAAPAKAAAPAAALQPLLLQQEWAEAVEVLVRDAEEQEARTGASWLSRFRDAKAVSPYLLS